MVFACDEREVGVVNLEERWSGGEHAKTSSDCTSTALVTASDLSELTAEALARQAQDGRTEAFEELVCRYEGPVFNFLNQFTGNGHDAEDLTQETFLKAYRGLQRYDIIHRFAPWLFTIARRTAINHFRSARRFEELSAAETATEATPAEALQQKDDQNSIWQLARRLKRAQYEVLWLRYGEGFSIQEIARVMSTNPLHIRVLHHRARAELAKLVTRRDKQIPGGPRLKTVPTP